MIGTSVKYVLEQDKAAFIRLTGISVLQSAANSIVSPSLRRAGTCPAVLGVCGVTELHSIWSKW
nr:unnamed protein product [Digitaria exilis]